MQLHNKLVLVNAILDRASLAKADLSGAELSWEDFDSG
jgi:uncharacterized protein YjbI with pentapeptide repeats